MTRNCTQDNLSECSLYVPVTVNLVVVLSLHVWEVWGSISDSQTKGFILVVEAPLSTSYTTVLSIHGFPTMPCLMLNI